MTATLLTVAMLSASPAAEPIVLHVSPHGLDGSTGRPATPTTGGVEDPFATPHRARDAIRELKRTNGGKLPGPITVRLQAGTYELAAPLVLGPRTPEPPNRRSCTSRRPALKSCSAAAARSPVGPRRLSTAGSAGPSICRTSGPASSIRINYGSAKNAGHVPGTQTRVTPASPACPTRPRRARARPGSITTQRISSAMPTRTMSRSSPSISGSVAGFASSRRIRIATTSGWCRARNIGSPKRTPSARTLRDYVENAIELLDEPGEWYCDRSTGRLSYLPKPGESPARLAARIAILAGTAAARG